jgi:hypothetical protein
MFSVREWAAWMVAAAAMPVAHNVSLLSFFNFFESSILSSASEPFFSFEWCRGAFFVDREPERERCATAERS